MLCAPARRAARGGRSKLQAPGLAVRVGGEERIGSPRGFPFALRGRQGRQAHAGGSSGAAGGGGGGGGGGGRGSVAVASPLKKKSGAAPLLVGCGGLRGVPPIPSRAQSISEEACRLREWRFAPGQAWPEFAARPDSSYDVSNVALKVHDALGAVLGAVLDGRCLAARALVGDPARPVSLAAGRAAHAITQTPARSAGDAGRRSF